MPSALKLHWKPDPELSVVHATRLVATGGTCTDNQTEALLIAPTSEINQRLVMASIDVGRFWDGFAERSIGGDPPGSAVSIALIEAGCSELQLEQTAKAVRSQLAEARLAFQRRYPKLDQQLPLRIGPLRERWETCGPGLLGEVERQVWQNSPPGDWWPPEVDVLAVQPLSGGAGGFSSDADAIWIEALLADSDPMVPELLRLVWLLTSLAIETHIRSRTGQRRLSHAWSLVSVPLVLSAGAQFDLFPAHQLPMDRALKAWTSGTPKTVETLESWWHQYRQSDDPLPIALRQLEALLET